MCTVHVLVELSFLEPGVTSNHKKAGREKKHRNEVAKDFPGKSGGDEEDHGQGGDDEQQQIPFLEQDCQAGDSVKNGGGSSVDYEV